MQKIGLLGGLSWVSTAQYYRRLNELMQLKLGGVSSARIVLESLNRQAYVDAVIKHKDEDAACAMIISACQDLERAGADFIVISCNDVHRFVPALKAQIQIPFLHIAEVAAQAIAAINVKKVGLLGVMKTMESDFYPTILKQNDIEVVLPAFHDRTYIHDKIYQELVNNVFSESTKAGYQAVINHLADSGAEGVVLACTEIPLLISSNEIDIASFDTTELHCVAAIQCALESG